MIGRIAIALALLAGTAPLLATAGGGPQWRMIGRNSKNSRSQPFEHRIRPANVNRLALKWVATTAGDRPWTTDRRGLSLSRRRVEPSPHEQIA